ncbi:hypothetical protein Vretimale_916 [Volvox reticuliferus]|uniref:Uncharacterized protein n=1 Tax=Volvox reticuliferus TaxID=1737510 RepID=A0A8J4C4X2_9CHLO|nr:hypothetical protein Vretifemale_2158 [Volvox reticuliferus]GIL94694.1 hypothetical protein Vretimale_916 [Volvox reticuliferus]
MLGVTGGRRPPATWPVPAGFTDRLNGAWEAVLDTAIQAAGGDPQRVTRDNLIEAVRTALPGLTSEEDDYVRRVTLAVLQEARGSNVFFADLEFLHASLAQGRVYPADLDPPHPTLAQSLFNIQTGNGSKSLDLLKTTGVNWKIPRGFLSRYNASNAEILRRATELVGARHDGNKDVVAGVWGRVDVGTFVEACRQVMGGLSREEEEYIAALASEQVPSGSSYVRDLPFLDKCLQQGRTPTSIKGPELLPTIFLNDTTSGNLDGLSLRHTGGRIF